MSVNKKNRSLWGSRSEAQRIYYQRQTIKRLEQENKQLKEQFEKQRYGISENCDLRLEIEQLKEQRQELRSWLEDEIKEIDRHTTTLDIFNTYDYETIHEMETKKITYKNVLSKLNELEG